MTTDAQKDAFAAYLNEISATDDMESIKSYKRVEYKDENGETRIAQHIELHPKTEEHEENEVLEMFCRLINGEAEFDVNKIIQDCEQEHLKKISNETFLTFAFLFGRHLATNTNNKKLEQIGVSLGYAAVNTKDAQEEISKYHTDEFMRKYNKKQEEQQEKYEQENRDKQKADISKQIEALQNKLAEL